MARVVGIDLPRSKRVEIGLRSIYGIGPTRAREVITKAGIGPEMRVNQLTDEQVSKLTTIIQAEYRVEGDLRRETSANIKRLMDTNSYRGMRHKKSLPVRGQRTHTNARTRKGPRKTAIKKK